MSNGIDHIAEAVAYAGRAENPDARKTLTYAGLAQTHALLALVEQQTIANLQVERDTLRAQAAGRSDAEAARMGADADELDTRIREGLGL